MQTTTKKKKPGKTAQRIIDEAREEARQSERGFARLDNKSVATLIRDRLRREFPGVKFSVRKRRGDCVNIHWDDMSVPADRVNEIVSEYKFGGFDGMIDLAYYIDRWLHPDGSMSFAQTDGTEDSRGCEPSGATDCPEPGAVLVRGGPRFVFAHRPRPDFAEF